MDFFDFIFVHLVSAYLKFRVKTLSCLKRAFFLNLGKTMELELNSFVPALLHRSSFSV